MTKATSNKKVDNLIKPKKGKWSAVTTGRDKSSSARVFITPGSGNLTVNKKDLAQYFPLLRLQQVVLKPFNITKTEGQFDIYCTVKGGGIAGQADAIRLAIARALDKIDSSFRPTLKEHRLLTRDARVVERKKYGLHKARKSTQFSKR